MNTSRQSSECVYVDEFLYVRVSVCVYVCVHVNARTLGLKTRQILCVCMRIERLLLIPNGLPVGCKHNVFQ